jgi:hypothetical protein
MAIIRTVISDEVTLGSQPQEATRLFVVDKDELLLRSMVQLSDDAWKPGVVKKAECVKLRVFSSRFMSDMKQHTIDPHCTCGIWSCKSRHGLAIAYPELLNQLHMRTRKFLYVSARVQIWGKVIEHETGYRSEYARIIPQTIQAYPRIHSAPQRKLIRALRDKYTAGLFVQQVEDYMLNEQASQ